MNHEDFGDEDDLLNAIDSSLNKSDEYGIPVTKNLPDSINTKFRAQFSLEKENKFQASTKHLSIAKNCLFKRAWEENRSLMV